MNVVLKINMCNLNRYGEGSCKGMLEGVTGVNAQQKSEVKL